MKRALLIVLGGYLLLAIGNKVAEAAGARRCHCPDNCWCRRPGLNVFRWVFPFHRSHSRADEESGSPLAHA